MQNSKLQIKIKNYLTPILIILVALMLGVVIILNREVGRQIDITSVGSEQNLRLLTLKAPGMFCLGCSASVEGYLGAIEGVQSVNASLATKQVDIVYDPSVVNKDTILANQILDAYGKELLSDEPFTRSSQAQTPSTTNLPQSLALKLQEAAGKISQLENQQEFQPLFDQIDQAIAQQDYDSAEDLLDELFIILGEVNNE